ncbi:acyltransferase [Planotetraspora silvatica]|uniref:Acyltransferase n=1 Tax=Planotetraspora silvatica TaxID=234614 RepID=A0A8J3UPQ2_9ACTN|nr:acyltransferase [Planotetraspora silvatica]
MRRKNYRTLDGIRGVAAFCIAAHHMPDYFRPWIPSAQIAVDLFFGLSGFVLAHVYDDRVRDGMTARSFMRLRFVRLYPLYILSIGLGVVYALLAILLHVDDSGWSWAGLLLTVPFALLMLPTPFTAGLFPLNPVMWSVFFELVANATWVVLWHRLRRTRFAIGTLVACGVLLSVAAVAFKSTALGIVWLTIPGGFARVMYAFLLGALIYRYHERLRVPRVRPVVLLLALPVLALIPMGYVGQLICALVVLPVLVLLGARSEPSGVTGLLCDKLGRASYALYVMHIWLYSVLIYVGLRAPEVGPGLGLLFITLLALGCLVLTEVFEKPARRWLGERTLRWLPEAAAEAPARGPVPTGGRTGGRTIGPRG